MKRHIVIGYCFFVVQLLATTQVFSQTNSSKKDSLSRSDTSSRVFKEGDEMPLFLEGEELEFIRTHLKYPQKEFNKGIEGQVAVSLVIFEDGSTGEIKVVSSDNKAFSKAGKHVIALMKKWKPAKVNGKPVAVLKTFTITFSIPRDVNRPKN